jgi:hypothetical protein
VKKLKNVVITNWNFKGDGVYCLPRCLLEFEDGDHKVMFTIKSFGQAIAFAKLQGWDATEFEARVQQWKDAGLFD